MSDDRIQTVNKAKKKNESPNSVFFNNFYRHIIHYRLPEMASFDYDQESASNIVYSILKENPIRRRF